MGNNFPVGLRDATSLVACEPLQYWRRVPESNRSKRICNPRRDLRMALVTVQNQGLRVCDGRAERPDCADLDEISPVMPANQTKEPQE